MHCAAKYLIVFICTIIFTGCVKPHPPLTRSQWIETTTREYSDVSNDQILTAAEELFTLADGDDFKFVHSEDSLYASRNWTVYVVLGMAQGTDYWLVKTSPTKTGIKVNVQVNRMAGMILPMPTTSAGMTASSTPMAGTPADGTAIYDVFWSRMDYLLGKKALWMTCKEADHRIEKKIVWGMNEQLCLSLNIKDNTPKQPMIPFKN